MALIGIALLGFLALAIFGAEAMRFHLKVVLVMFLIMGAVTYVWGVSDKWRETAREAATATAQNTVGGAADDVCKPSDHDAFCNLMRKKD